MKSYTERTPRALLPKRQLILAIAEVLRSESIYELTEKQFVGAVMKAAHGMTDPWWAKEAYRLLMEEAGLPPLSG